MTAWYIKTINGTRPVNALTLTLAVDSSDVAVLDAIETAAAMHDIVLERIEPNPGFLTKDTA